MSKTDRPKFARNKFLHEEKDRKRAEAKVRQEIYDKLTIEQKLAKLGDRPAVKQRAKLFRQMEESVANQTRRSAVIPPPEQAAALEEIKKEKKGQKAKRQGRKDKKAHA